MRLHLLPQPGQLRRRLLPVLRMRGCRGRGRRTRARCRRWPLPPCALRGGCGRRRRGGGRRRGRGVRVSAEVPGGPDRRGRRHSRGVHQRLSGGGRGGRGERGRDGHGTREAATAAAAASAQLSRVQCGGRRGLVQPREAVVRWLVHGCSAAPLTELRVETAAAAAAAAAAGASEIPSSPDEPSPSPSPPSPSTPSTAAAAAAAEK